MNQSSHHVERFRRLRLEVVKLWSRNSGRFRFRFALSLLIVSAALIGPAIRSLEPYRYAFLELQMNADQRSSARLFVNTGESKDRLDVFKLRIERGKEPETYRIRIPARDVTELQLEPSSKPGLVRIQDARVVDLKGRKLRQLVVDDFEILEGFVQLNYVDRKLEVHIADGDRPRGRIRISGEIELNRVRDGIEIATLLWILVIIAAAGALSFLLRHSYLRRATNTLVLFGDHVERAAGRRRWAMTVVVTWCVALGLIVVATAAINQIRFYENHPYFYDPVDYSLRNISLSLDVENQPRLEAAVKEAKTNFRYPLRTIPLILTDSSLLAHPLGHMITAGLTFLALLILFCWTVFRRSGSLLYGLAATALLAAIPWHFDCRLGLGAYWLDTVSAYFLLLAALALINWERRDSLGWVALFAVFASCSVLSRYVSVAYVLAVCGPLFVYLILKKVRNGVGVRDSVVRPLIVSGSILGVFSIPYLMVHFSINYDYYSTFGYALGRTPSETFNAITKNLASHYLGGVAITVLIILFAGHFWTASGTGFKRLLFDATSSLLVFSSLLLFQVFVIRTVEAVHQFGYVAILMVVTFMSPIPWPEFVATRKKVIISFSVLICAAIIGIGAARDSRSVALNPTMESRAQKKLDLELAAVLISEGSGVVWAPFFDECGAMPAVEAFLGGGVFPEPTSIPTFSVHETYFTGWFPGKNKDEICDAVLSVVNSEVNFAVVLGNLDQIDTLFNNDYSRAVSHHLAKMLSEDKEWEEIYRSRTSRYGELVGYRNRRLLGPHGGAGKTISGLTLSDPEQVFGAAE